MKRWFPLLLQNSIARQHRRAVERIGLTFSIVILIQPWSMFYLTTRRELRSGSGRSGKPSLFLSTRIRVWPVLIPLFLASSLYGQTTAQKPQPEKKQQQRYSRSATSGSPGHIFWVVPAFKVDYGKNFKPLTPREKFQEWARASYDPLGLGAGAAEAATLEYSSKDGFCGYGGGWDGYGKCFGSLELDANVSSFIGDFALTVALHQDPRYFRLGEGSFGKRVWYAISRVFDTYNDHGHTVFYSSALTGTVAAAGISNLYYPQQDRTFGHTLSRVGIDLGNTALYNAAAEFWPEVHHKFRQIF